MYGAGGTIACMQLELKGGKSRPHQDSIPDRPARGSVSIPTELPGPYLCRVYIPETNHVSTVYDVAAVLYLQSVLHEMLFRP